MPALALAPEPVHVQAPVLPQAPVVVAGTPDARTTSAMREFYRLAPQTFHR